MANIFLKVTIARFSKFKFLGLKNLSPGQFSGSFNSHRYSWILLKLKNQSSGSKTICGFSIILILKGVMTF